MHMFWADSASREFHLQRKRGGSDTTSVGGVRAGFARDENVCGRTNSQALLVLYTALNVVRVYTYVQSKRIFFLWIVNTYVYMIRTYWFRGQRSASNFSKRNGRAGTLSQERINGFMPPVRNKTAITCCVRISYVYRRAQTTGCRMHPFLYHIAYWGNAFRAATRHLYIDL